MEGPGLEISSYYSHSLYHEVSPFPSSTLEGACVCVTVRVFLFTIKALILLLASFLNSIFSKQSPVLAQSLTTLSAYLLTF